MGYISLRDGEKARLNITKAQEDEISKLYRQVYLDLKKKMDKLSHSGTTSESLRKTYLNKMVKELKEAYKSLGVGLEKSIEKGIGDTATAVVQNNADWLKKAGLTIEGAYSYVPKDIVSMLVTGQLYGEGWTLSKAIWGQSQKHAEDINKIVAAGVAANKSAYDIAKDLEQYVNPEARKEWDWSKVYPGTSKKVDYNAQRLARTMVSHAYQQSLLATTKYNPFVTGYKWRSAHTHRTCELCNSRDGKIFSAEELPLDHPNGLCTFLVELEGSLEDVANRLGDWANGKEDPELDLWYNSMQGKPTYKEIKEPPKPPVEKRKKAVKPPVEIRSEKWVNKNLENLRRKVSANWGDLEWSKLQSYLLTLDEDKLRWLASGDGTLKGMGFDRGGYWSPSRHFLSVDLMKDSRSFNPKGKYSTLFHEWGHLLDSKHGGTGTNLAVSGSKKFGKTIYKSLQKEYNAIVDTKGKLLPEVRSSLAADDRTSGVQDIISGLSQDKNRIVWGHSASYWKRKGEDSWKEVTSEAWANMNEAFINGGKAEESFLKYFPESYQLFKEEVRSRVK